MKKKEYNESVIVNKITKQSTEYNSVEEASKATGLSTNAIRLRCNKRSDAIPKDGITCEWKDITTKRARQAKKSLSKGHSYELQVLHELEKLGFSNLSTSRYSSKQTDDAKIDLYDPDNQLPCYIQNKFTASIPNIISINKECGLKDKPLCIMWKSSKSTEQIKEFAIIPKEFFYELIKNYSKR